MKATHANDNTSEFCAFGISDVFVDGFEDWLPRYNAAAIHQHLIRSPGSDCPSNSQQMLDGSHEAIGDD